MTCQHAWTETTTGRGAKDLHCGPCSQPRSLGVEMGPSYPPFLHLELSKRPCTSFNVLALLIAFVSHDGLLLRHHHWRVCHLLRRIVRSRGFVDTSILFRTKFCGQHGVYMSIVNHAHAQNKNQCCELPWAGATKTPESGSLHKGKWQDANISPDLFIITQETAHYKWPQR